MPKLIELRPVPRQSLSVQIDNNFYDLSIKYTGGVMSVDITINNVIVVTGCRAVSGTPLINYLHLENGNFIISTINQEIPYYKEFGSTQSLIYISQRELEQFRALR